MPLWPQLRLRGIPPLLRVIRSVCLRLRPFVTFRMFDARLHDAKRPPFPLTVPNGRYDMHLCEGAPSLKLCLRPRGGKFVADYELSVDVSYRSIAIEV